QSERRGHSFFRHAFLAPAFSIEFIDFSQDIGDIVSRLPTLVMGLEVGEIADPPHVIALAVFFHILPFDILAGDLLTQFNTFDHRAIAEAATADVIDLSNQRILEELVKGTYKVKTVNIVSDLLSFI